MKMPRVLRLPRWVRWLAIAASGALVLAAVAGDGDPAPEVSANTKPRQTAQVAVAGTAAAPRLDVERLERPPRSATEPIGDVFGATNWYVPPPPPPPQAMPAPPPPPPPTAPALPFAYLGTYADAAAPVLILSKGDRVYTVSPGDTIEGSYRVESVSGRVAEFIYLPLNIRQTLAVGGT